MLRSARASAPHRLVTMSRRRAFAGLMALSLAAGLAEGAEAASVKWDVSLPWGPSEFHTVNAVRFAAEVKAATNGELELTIHAGGSLGVKANESLRAVADGAVPMAEYAAFQNVGELPILGIESIPFLVKDYDQLKAMHALVRPIWEAELAKRNQKVLYIVPWPSQNFFLKKASSTPDDIKGVRMRTYDKVTAEMIAKIGMVPLQMNNPDIVPSLASGKLDAVMTSGTTAVAQKYWEFMKFAYNTNHLWASNMMVVNLDSWKKLSPVQQSTVEALGRKLEPEFWQVSMAEHDKKMKELVAAGMKVEKASDALLASMRKATETMADDFGKANPAAAPIIAEFKKKVGS